MFGYLCNKIINRIPLSSYFGVCGASMDMRRLFYPEGIAVVGASPSMTLGKLPYYQIIKDMGYRGKLYPVNPAYEEIEGVKVYPSLEELPEAVDLGIVSDLGFSA